MAKLFFIAVDKLIFTMNVVYPVLFGVIPLIINAFSVK